MTLTSGIFTPDNFYATCTSDDCETEAEPEHAQFAQQWPFYGSTWAGREIEKLSCLVDDDYLKSALEKMHTSSHSVRNTLENFTCATLVEEMLQKVQARHDQMAKLSTWRFRILGYLTVAAIAVILYSEYLPRPDVKTV